MRCKTEVCSADGGRIRSVPRILEFGSSAATDDYFEEQHLQIPWYDVVMEYSRRGFSHRTDKLRALSAIARDYERNGELGSYVAGLFTKALCWDLLWSCQDTNYGASSARFAEEKAPRQPEPTWVAPSWSWASRSHPIYYHTMHHNRNMFRSSHHIKDLHIDIEPVSSLVPNGALRFAALTMRCHSWKITWGEPWLSSFSVAVYLDDEPCVLTKG